MDVISFKIVVVSIVVDVEVEVDVLLVEVVDVVEFNNIQSKYRLIPILGPIPAKLFNNELVAFFYTRNKMIVEFLIK